MINPFRVAALLFLATSSVALAADHPLVSRFPGSAILKSESRFAEVRLVVKQIEKADSVKAVSGKLTRFAFEAPRGKPVSEVYHHYQAAVKASGFEILYNCGGQSCSPESEGRHFNEMVAPKDLRAMQGRPEGQRYFSAQLRRAGGDAFAALYCVRDEAPYESPERRVVCDLVIVEAQP
jgi:OOP family OmpA-OmpF porin